MPQPPLVTKEQATEFKASPLSISTCTVITNLNAKIHLGLLSRFINVYEQNAPELDLKAGGAYNLEFYGNCARGETLIDKIKPEFNNQATLKFKYWGFRNVNVKIFANGTLQMTGLKYEDEAKEVGALIIEIIKNIKISITSDITTLKNSAKTCDFQLIYDPISKNVFYYRKYYERFLNAYNFDTDLVYDFDNFFSRGMEFHEDLARVKLNEKWGFFNKNGKVVIPLMYTWAYDYEHGLAKVDLGNYKYIHIDKKGNCIKDCP